jgi:bifunctional non-homologous end joining protein LigD
VRPTFIRPLDPADGARPPRGPGWLFEPKFDGYRLEVIKDGRSVRLFSKSGAEYTERLPAFVDAFIDLPARSVIADGELCFIRGNGQADFHRLMAEMRTKWPDQDQLVLIMFDLQHQDGVDLMPLPLPLTERKRDLVRLCRKSVLSLMKLIQTFPDGQVLFEHCASYGFEGIVAKRLDRPYVSGPSRSWVKVKCPGWKRENSERFRMFEGSRGR